MVCSDRRQTAIASTGILAASAAVKAASRAVFGLGNSTPPLSVTQQAELEVAVQELPEAAGIGLAN